MRNTILTLILAAGLAACVKAGPSQELVNARTLYTEASSGDTGQLNPDELRRAQLALARAEAAHRDEPGSRRERDLAYQADRHIRIAMAHARAEQLRMDAARERQAYTARLEQERSTATAELEGQRRQIEQQDQALDARTQELQRQQVALQAEREARVQAEQEASQAMTRLEEFARIQRERDRTVVTLPGAVLFRNTDHRLLPASVTQLERVVEALRNLGPTAQVTIVGHTDDRGQESRNEQVSLARAESVRQFLIERGIPADRLVAEGHGEREPLADNRSMEGRAANRRVEIVIREPVATAPAPQR